MTNAAKPDAPWAELIQVLALQAQKYEEYTEFLKRKQDLIIKGDTDALKDHEKEEKEFISSLEIQEDSRRETAGECMDGEVTLRGLLDAAPGEYAEELEAAAIRLMDALNNTALANKTNAELVGEAMRFVEYNLNLLSSTGVPNESTYSPTGRLQDADKKIVKHYLNKQV
jgi:hypothetical protein